MIYQQFFRETYLRTGWLPMEPLTQKVKVGDVCQIHHGLLQPLLNIATDGLVWDGSESDEIALNATDWRIQQGVRQTYCASESVNRELGEDKLITKQGLKFKQAGSFVFHGLDPICRLLMNWSQIADELTLKLTHNQYAFRDAYVITGVVAINQWGLTMAGQAEAQLDMMATTHSTDVFDLVAHSSSRAEQCSEIARFEQSNDRPAYFFKAKKLQLSDHKREFYLSRLLEQHAGKPHAHTANWLNADPLNLMRFEELNANSCNDFFTWVDANLDDVERLAG